MRVAYSPLVNNDYSLLSRALFLLFLSLASVFAGWLVYHAIFLATSLRHGGAASWPVAVAFVLSAAVVVVRQQRKAHLEKEQSEAVHLQQLVSPLARNLGIAAPAVRISPREGDARVAFSGRSPYLVAPRVMELLARVNPESIRPVLIHELAHITNGDARAAQVAQVVIRICLLAVGLVAGAELLAYADGLRIFAQRYGLQAVGLYEAGRVVGNIAWIVPFSVALVLSYAAFLRMREFEADRVVASHGLGEAMAAALLRTTNPVKNRLRMHPSAAQRAKSLRERTTLHSVEYQTISLVSAVAWLIGTSAASIPEGVLSFLAFGSATVLGLLVLCLLAVSFGRRLSMDGGSVVAKSKELAKSSVAILAGITTAAVCVNLLMDFTAGAPVHLQAWEAMLQGLAGAAGLLTAFFVCYLIGNATASSLLPVGGMRYLWLLLGFVLSVFGYLLMFNLASAVLDPYGISVEAKFWIAATGAQEVVAKVYPQFPSPARWKIGPEGVVLVTVTMVACTFLFLFLGLEAVRALAKHLNLTAGKSQLVQLAIWGALTAAVLGPAVLVSGLAIDVGKELRMNPSMWISCSTPDAGGIPYSSSEATQTAEAFARKVVDEMDSLVTMQTQSPGVFVGMREHGCNAHAMERYPAVRALLARFGITEDVFVNLAFSGTSLHLETQFGATNETENLPLVYGSSASGVARAIAYKHTPYRMALRELREPGTSLPTTESPMLRVMSHPDSRQRAWAHNTYGNAHIASNPALAREQLMRALELLPREATFHSSYAYLLLLNNQCDEAEPHVVFAASKGRLGSLMALGYARCLRNKGRADEALAALWKLKGLYRHDALFSAALGEMALWANKTILARGRLTEAMTLAGDKSPPACARLFNELLNDVDICNVERCVAPLPAEKLTLEEKYCWASYAGRYGHRFEVFAK